MLFSMSNRIAFTDIDVSKDGYLRCSVRRGSSKELWIELPYSFNPEPDLIAAAYAALCGTAFDEIEIDLPLGPGLAEIIEKSCQASLTYLPGKDIRRKPGQAQALNFSGGFDSLAAKEIMPEAHLVSLDFGGRFSREIDFFSRFYPLTFRTNLVDLGLNKYSWTFMGIGSVLLTDELALRSYGFGSIQAGSLPRLFTRPLDQRTLGLAGANSLGLVVENPVAGISEIGAIQISANKNPTILLDILRSVALPNEDKFQRKYQMIEAVSKDLNLNFNLPEYPKITKLPEWGDSFARDLASMAVASKLGIDAVSRSYKDGIPTAVAEKLNALSLTFMERFNPHAYRGVRQDILADWYSRLIKNGVHPYTRQDWIDAATAMKLLRGQL